MNELQDTLPLIVPGRARTIAREILTAQRDELGAFTLAVSASGIEKAEIAQTLGIDASQFTKITDGTAHFPIRRTLKFCELTGDVYLEYLAFRRGFALVQLESETQRQLREANEALHKERERVRLLTEVLQGKALAR